jgi:hypothetical protein
MYACNCVEGRGWASPLIQKPDPGLRRDADLGERFFLITVENSPQPHSRQNLLHALGHLLHNLCQLRIRGIIGRR